MAEQNSIGSDAIQDLPQQIDYDLSMAVERFDSWVDGAIRLLPNIFLALVVMILFYGLAVLVRWLVQRQSIRRGRHNLGRMLGSFSKWAVILSGFLLAATIVLPTLNPGDLIAGLGVSSVAIGFAFKDILQNWLAGLLILLRQPFEVDDQIKVDSHEGTVEQIETRATIIKTYDGQRILIPNSYIYTHAVIVKTAYEKRRSQYDININYDNSANSIGETCERIRGAIAQVAEVETNPPPEALAWDLTEDKVTIRARWWTNSHRTNMSRVRAAVINAIRQVLDQSRTEPKPH
ncbi:MscS Mechanosensitive ion channel [Nitrosococcus oceani ATCC 19707]|uniref:Small-conductance mechanosensitive channel n=2 Tax=Nitrosococcus oceani TaxID=1229 RepID=Q3JA26_NITOC|nr:mechanosensitive ion channel domain-containing protein [Nitrosococcus oceani]ABA58320.1 MscS Mechanosensitive ion channel [Nitrosococcus oceani ATCC 19707]EDZ68063.1 transporter, MscS family [Nitrosococcus oceani AFC27]KFI19250.1 mechanosensitive ion channel protein MscS [Nitrosococcus oceani C-27]GEM18707.1 mechanosensitive ion channel protein MscS [Nitrosococcus oceani]